MRACEFNGIAIIPLGLATAFQRVLASRVADQNAPPCFGRRGKEVAAAVPLLLRAVPDEPQIGFVNQSSRLKRLPRLLLGEPLGREFAQLLVDQRQKLGGGVWVALLDGGQDAGHLAHRR